MDTCCKCRQRPATHFRCWCGECWRRYSMRELDLAAQQAIRLPVDPLMAIRSANGLRTSETLRARYGGTHD